MRYWRSKPVQCFLCAKPMLLTNVTIAGGKILFTWRRMGRRIFWSYGIGKTLHGAHIPYGLLFLHGPNFLTLVCLHLNVFKFAVTVFRTLQGVSHLSSGQLYSTTLQLSSAPETKAVCPNSKPSIKIRCSGCSSVVSPIVWYSHYLAVLSADPSPVQVQAQYFFCLLSVIIWSLNCLWKSSTLHPSSNSRMCMFHTFCSLEVIQVAL